MDDSIEDPYKLLYARILRLKVDELMQEPYDPPEEDDEE